MTRLLHSPTPYGVNLQWGADRWSDFLFFRPRFIFFRTPRFWSVPAAPFTYPAPLGVAFGLLYKLAHPLPEYLAACVAALLAWVWWLARSLHARGFSFGLASAFAATVVLTAFPVWFLFSTGNIEGLVALVLGLGVLAALRGRWWLAAALIGAAGAMKIYPLILLGLLLSRRRYKQFVFGIFCAMLLTLLSLDLLGPSIPLAQAHLAVGFAFLKRYFVFSSAALDFVTNHSLFAPIKNAIFRHYPATLGQPVRQHALNVAYLVYMVCAAIFGITAYLVRIRRLPLLNQTLALTVCALLLPPLSIDYTLVNLLLPFGFLCLYAADGKALRPPLTMAFACFALLFTFGTFFTLKYRLAAPIRTLSLAVLLFTAMTQPFPWAELDEA